MRRYLPAAMAIMAIMAAAPCAARQGGAQSGHSVYANVSGMNIHAGVGYSYEWAFARRLTVSGSAWLKGEVYSLTGSPFDSFLVFPALSVEPRFYYNTDRRRRKGRSTYLNSGSHLGATFSYFMPSIYGTRGTYRNYGHYGIAPHWDMRRVLSGNVFMDFQAGILVLAADGVDSAWGPDLNFKIGYAF